MKLADTTRAWLRVFGGFADSYSEALNSEGSLPPDSAVGLDLQTATEIGCAGLDPGLCRKALQRALHTGKTALERRQYAFEYRPKTESLQRASMRRDAALAEAVLARPLRAVDIREASLEFMRIAVGSGRWDAMDEAHALEAVRLALVIEDIELAAAHLARLSGRRSIRSYAQEVALYATLVSRWPPAGAPASAAIVEAFDALFDIVRQVEFSRHSRSMKLAPARIELAGLRDRLLTGHVRWPRVFDYLAGRVDPTDVHDPPTGTTSAATSTPGEVASGPTRIPAGKKGRVPKAQPIAGQAKAAAVAKRAAARSKTTDAAARSTAKTGTTRRKRPKR